MAKRIMFALLTVAVVVALAQAKIANVEFDDKGSVAQLSNGFELEYLLQRNTQLRVDVQLKGHLPPGILPVYVKVFDSMGKEIGGIQPAVLNGKKTVTVRPNPKLAAETLKVRLETYNGKTGPGTFYLKVTTIR